jgi:hypothetical protein
MKLFGEKYIFCLGLLLAEIFIIHSHLVGLVVAGKSMQINIEFLASTRMLMSRVYVATFVLRTGICTTRVVLL